MAELVARVRNLLSTVRGIREGRVRSRWPRERLAAHQASALRALVAHAKQHSPLYADLYADIAEAGALELRDLPCVTKSVLMADFDRWVTDRRLSRRMVQEYLDAGAGDALLLGRYRAANSSGSSGRPGCMVFSPEEWQAMHVCTARAVELSGYAPKPFRKPRVCMIGAADSRHLSRSLFESNDPWVARRLCLAADRSLPELTEQLEAFDPLVLSGYPSVLHQLASEQLAGRLSIAPRFVSTGAEVRTPDTSAAIREAWGVEPFDVYGTTEGLIGAECQAHAGIHIFEDLVLLEVVDEEGRPVPDGVEGRKILLTNLVARTTPIIRYEIDDLVRVTSEPCACGSTFRRITSLVGRADDLLRFEGGAGEPRVLHPMTLRAPLDALADVAQYQLVLRDDGLHVLVVPVEPSGSQDVLECVQRRVGEALSRHGLREVPVRARAVAELPRDASIGAKIRLVRDARGTRERLAASSPRGAQPELTGH